MTQILSIKGVLEGSLLKAELFINKIAFIPAFHFFTPV